MDMSFASFASCGTEDKNPFGTEHAHVGYAVTQKDKFLGELELQALTDLLKRGRGGSFIYAILWLTIGAVSGLYRTHPTLLYANLAFMILSGMIRAPLGSLPAAFIGKHCKAVSRVFVTSVCLQSLHFGVLAAYIYHEPDLQAFKFPVMLALAATVGAGTATLAINKTIRILYPTLMTMPFVVGLLMYDVRDNLILIFTSGIFMIYMYRSTEHICGDYWAAILNAALLSERAIEFQELSVTDPLTRLHNRAYFFPHLEKEWRRASRERRPVTAMFIDLDYFKFINDTYGHAAGDLCIQSAAKLLAKYNRRSGDAVVRFGGEEFLALFPNMESCGAAKIAEKIIADFHSLQVTAGETKIDLRCSIGISSCVPDASSDPETLIAHADEAMYTAKEKGRDRFEIFQNEAEGTGRLSR